MATFTYPEDRTGSATSNKIQSELHSVTFGADADFHFIVPTFAPYYATGFRILRVVAGNRIPLSEGIDFHHALRFMSASDSVGRPVYGGLVLTNISEDSLYEIEVYQTLGGGWTLDTAGMVEMAANIIKNPRSLSWEQVTTIPQVFNPTNHPWSFADMVGQSELVQAVMAIANAVASGTTDGSQHYLLKGNVHDLSKFDLDLGLVPNYPAAELPQAITGTDHTSLLTPLLLRQVLQSMGLVGLSQLATDMRAHLLDKNAPHAPTATQIGLGQVIDLPLATPQDITRNLNVDKYLTLSGLKLWMGLHGGSIQEKTAAPIAQGALLHHYCNNNYDRMGVYADGKGGTYESVIKIKDTECGWVAQVPITNPKKGEILDTYCSGSSLMNLVANGSGGVTSTVAEINSPTCTSANHPPPGTLIGTTCEGTTLIRTLANGAGGTTIERVENSSQCKVNANPVKGTLISFGCIGFNMIGTYADGNGGTYEGVLERNSEECGYVTPTLPPAVTFPPSGSIIGTTCSGTNLQEIRANGSGGQYTVTTQVNSPECGYVPTNSPAPTSTPSPTAPPNRIGQISYSSTLSNIYRGDTEVHTTTLTGWAPNKRYVVEIWGRSTAWGLPYERMLDTFNIDTDSSGYGMERFTRTDTGIVDVGRYESWMTEQSSGKASNTLTRIFHGPR